LTNGRATVASTNAEEYEIAPADDAVAIVLDLSD
jgi:hypothetical protein